MEPFTIDHLSDDTAANCTLLEIAAGASDGTQIAAFIPGRADVAVILEAGKAGVVLGNIDKHDAATRLRRVADNIDPHTPSDGDYRSLDVTPPADPFGTPPMFDTPQEDTP